MELVPKKPTTAASDPRPSEACKAEGERPWYGYRPLVVIVFAGLFVAAAVSGAACWRYGSLAAAQARIDGHVVWLESPYRISEPIAPGESARVSVVARNLTSQPVTVWGCQADCDCVLLDDLPVTIAGWEARELSIVVYTDQRDAGKNVSHLLKFYTSPPDPSLLVRITVPVARDL